MEQSHSGETDPPEIRTRLESIQRQRALIEDLATRLKAAQLEHDRLETELNEYRRCFIAPIRKCPEEVLLMIFESFAVAAPELVASLLQVCKRWRDIAANTPRLWTHIKIKVEPIWDQREAAWKDAAMIEKHLEHSASLPLHIGVDLKNMLSERSQKKGLRNGILSNGCRNKMCSDARKFMSDLDGGESGTMALCEYYGPKQVLGTIDTLVGEDGIHMGRRKSFAIYLPCKGRDVKEIWELFSGPTPQLTELFVEGEELSRRFLATYITFPDIFPDLSSLEALTLHGIVKDFRFLRLTFPSVKRLDLKMDISHSSQLSLFTSLEYLDVLFHGESKANTVQAIRLPLLRDLTIDLYGPTGVEWHVPVLQTLKIFDVPDDKSKVLPDVQAIKVCWELDPPSDSMGSEGELHRTLQTIISKYNDAQELSIHTPLKPVWEKYVQDLSEEKRLVLPTVSFYKQKQ